MAQGFVMSRRFLIACWAELKPIWPILSERSSMMRRMRPTVAETRAQMRELELAMWKPTMRRVAERRTQPGWGDEFPPLARLPDGWRRLRSHRASGPFAR